MMSDYSEFTLEQYRDALASSDPTPGGGTAAAVALAQGAALACMVCDLTTGKEKWQAGWQAADVVREVASPLLIRGHELASEDAAAFDAVMTAFRMPRESDDEKSSRITAIEVATLGAAEVPLETAICSLDLLETLPPLAEYGNGNAVSDVGVSALLLSAACRGALFNVQINASSLPAAQSKELLAKVDSMRGRIRTVSKLVMNVVDSRLSD
uniref:Glutamate formiminotransferase (FTCD) n=1 Tax=uncultured marine group II/III euryarchaeote KM3_28_D12 TaxID=1456431 RepID=A0A075GZJ6_9EURY|nr:glutamate formiminotransferase (FTCD) [uncultured marine group II/III euryarchaeote KM3_28_D12]